MSEYRPKYSQAELMSVFESVLKVVTWATYPWEDEAPKSPFLLQRESGTFTDTDYDFTVAKHVFRLISNDKKKDTIEITFFESVLYPASGKNVIDYIPTEWNMEPRSLFNEPFYTSLKFNDLPEVPISTLFDPTDCYAHWNGRIDNPEELLDMRDNIQQSIKDLGFRVPQQLNKYLNWGKEEPDFRVEGMIDGDIGIHQDVDEFGKRFANYYKRIPRHERDGQMFYIVKPVDGEDKDVIFIGIEKDKPYAHEEASVRMNIYHPYILDVDREMIVSRNGGLSLDDETMWQACAVNLHAIREHEKATDMQKRLIEHIVNVNVHGHMAYIEDGRLFHFVPKIPSQLESTNTVEVITFSEPLFPMIQPMFVTQQDEESPMIIRESFDIEHVPPTIMNYGQFENFSEFKSKLQDELKPKSVEVTCKKEKEIPIEIEDDGMELE